MDFNTTIDLIIKDLEEAREIIDDLKKYPGVPALQVELAKSKCKSAGEVIAMLKTLKDSSPVAQMKPLQQVQAQKQQTPEEKKTIEPTPAVNKVESKKNLIEEEESHIVADRFSDHSNRLNEQLGNLKSDEDISEILKTKPLTSLSEAIGVNDKFHFIREIFDDNQKAYAQAISRLEIADSLSDARAVIMSYTGDGNENEAVKQLLDLVKRKLSSNE
jgi:HPt (histidine-containing phosphotransfer) domain-containing protein